MNEVRPFRIAIADEALTDLRNRLHNTRWPDAEPVDDWSQGIPLEYTRELAAYWADCYSWRAREDALNRFPQFMADVDGVDIHLIHQRSPHADALPLIITHGWPGSIVEFQKIIGPLTDPTAHGGRAEDAFHVVCPSLPGYGFSGRPTTTGWGVERIASASDTVMGRLGYQRYGAQGVTGVLRSPPRSGEIKAAASPYIPTCRSGSPPPRAWRTRPMTISGPSRR